MNDNLTNPQPTPPMPSPMPEQSAVPQPPTAGYAPQPQVVMVEKKRNGLAVASMVLGIIALVFCWLPLANVISYLLAVVAAGLGLAALIKARRAKVGLGMAIAGLLMAVASVFAATVVNTATVAAIDEGISAVTTDDSEIDVTLGKATTDDFGTTTLEVTITNTSDETQSPWVSVSAESADGSEQYDTGSVIVNDLKPGQTATEEVVFTQDVASDAKFVVTDIV